MQIMVIDLTLTESELEILRAAVLNLDHAEIDRNGLRSNEVSYLAERISGVLEGMACAATTATELADDEDHAISLHEARVAGNA